MQHQFLFTFNDKVDRFDVDVRVEGVLVEENRAARKVGHVKSFLKNITINIVRCFLQDNNWQFVFLSTSGPRVPVVNAENPLHR